MNNETLRKIDEALQSWGNLVREAIELVRETNKIWDALKESGILEFLRKLANEEVKLEPLENCPKCGYKLRGPNHKALKITYSASER